MSKSYKQYGQHKFALRNGEVVSANITYTTINCRGLVASYNMCLTEEGKLRLAPNMSPTFEVPRKHTFDDKTKAMKALFNMKLKGEM